MNSEKRKKRQSIKIIASEAIMVLAVIAIVSVLALIVSGYWLNSDFKVERQGLLQVSSMPTGADVNIDGESSWLQRTNTSKVLPSGEHQIVLSKEGYDSWSKTISITEGLLYRIHYPRLFLQERDSEKVLETTDTTFATISPNHNIMLLANNTTNWRIVDLSQETLKPKTIDIAPYFSSISLAEGASVGLFGGTIIQANWDESNSHLLFNVKNGETFEWVLLDIKNPERSINLTKEFGADFSSVEIIDSSSNQLFAVRNSNLHKIDIPSKAISSIIVENIVSYDHFDNELLFIAKQATPVDSEPLSPASFTVGLMKIGDTEIKELAELDSSAKVAISKFYDTDYLTIMQDNHLYLHSKQDYDDVTEYQLSFSPEHLKIGHNGEFIMMWTGPALATLDMELGQVREWRTASDRFAWLDNYMVYSVSEGSLETYDFDGFNNRHLAKNVSSHFPAGITENKWLYYFSDGELVREWIVEH